MAIVKNKKKSNYTVTDNKVIKDTRMSWKAKGILVYMLSLPVDWEVHIKEIIKHATNGESSFRSGLEELKELGYIHYNKTKDDKGHFKHIYTVYEKPKQENPYPENLDMEKDDVLLSTNELSTKELNNLKEKINKKEKNILSIMKKIPNYPFEPEKDLSFIRELKKEFSAVDFVKETKKWRTYKLDKPLKKDSNSRLQYRNWIENSKKYNKEYQLEETVTDEMADDYMRRISGAKN